MKLLRNKSDFREWMMKDFIKIKSEWYPLDYIDAEVNSNWVCRILFPVWLTVCRAGMP